MASAVELRLAGIVETLGNAVDLMARQIAAEVNHLGQTSGDAGEELRSTVAEVSGRATEALEALRKELASIRSAVAEQTQALRDEVAEQGKLLDASTGEAARHITTARHELALSVNRLKRWTLRYALMLGAGTALFVLLLARMLWPFWGMGREDAEAWSTGMRLRERYEAASPAERKAILQAAGWSSMPGAAPSSWSPSPPGGP